MKNLPPPPLMALMCAVFVATGLRSTPLSAQQSFTYGVTTSVNDPGRPAFDRTVYKVRSQPWVDSHQTQPPVIFQGEVVVFEPTDIPAATLKHAAIVFVQSHGFQSDPAETIVTDDRFTRAVLPFLAAGYTCFFINHGDATHIRTEEGAPIDPPVVGWTSIEQSQQLRDALRFIKFHSVYGTGNSPPAPQFDVDPNRLIIAGGSSGGVLALGLHAIPSSTGMMMSALENPLPGVAPHDSAVFTGPLTAIATVGAAGSDGANFRFAGDWAFPFVRPNALFHPDLNGRTVEDPANPGTMVTAGPLSYNMSDPLILNLFSPPPVGNPPVSQFGVDVMLFSAVTTNPPPDEQFKPTYPFPYPVSFPTTGTAGGPWGWGGGAFLTFPTLNFDRSTQTLGDPTLPSNLYPDIPAYNVHLANLLTSSSVVNNISSATGAIYWNGGDKDRFSPKFQMTTLSTACIANQVPFYGILFTGEGHGVRDLDEERPRRALAFIDKHLFNSPDSDEDGIPDTGETLTNPFDADTDGDGASDHEEILAGTSPTDPLSVFRITDIQRFTTTGGNHAMIITFPVVAGKRYRLLQTNPPPVAGLGASTTEHGVVALRENLWTEVPGTPFQAASGGTSTYTVTMTDPLTYVTTYLDALLTESRFFKVEVRDGNDQYLGVFTRPVGRFVETLVAADPSSSAPALNLFSAPLHGPEIYEGKFTAAGADHLVFDAATAAVLAAADFTGPPEVDPLKAFFPRYVVLVTHDASRRPGQPLPENAVETKPPLTDHGMEGDWWPVKFRSTTTATDDTLVLDTTYSGIPVTNLPAGSSVVVRSTTSFDDLFVNVFATSSTTASNVAVGQVVTLRRPFGTTGVTLTATYQGLSASSVHIWNVVSSLQPGVVHSLSGRDIRLLPDEAAMFMSMNYQPPPLLSSGQAVLVNRAGWVPMRRIQAYLHPQASLGGQREFKGINYPVDEIKLDSSRSYDTNWCGWVESGLEGPQFMGQTAPPVSSTTYFQFDDIWRGDCSCLFSTVYLPQAFPILASFPTPGGNPLNAIALWGFPGDPAWWPPLLMNPATNAPYPTYSNTAYYWLPPRQTWFAFDPMDLSINVTMDVFRRSSWAKTGTNEYPLLGGRGLITNLDSSLSSIHRWVRPLTYTGFARRERR